jgi:hypothetical protein
MRTNEPSSKAFERDTIPKPVGLGMRSPHKARSVQCVFTEYSVLVRSLFNTAEGRSARAASVVSGFRNGR